VANAFQVSNFFVNSVLTFYLTGYILAIRLSENEQNIKALDRKLPVEISQKCIENLCDELVEIFLDIQNTNRLWKYISGVQYAFLYGLVTWSTYSMLFINLNLVGKFASLMATC